MCLNFFFEVDESIPMPSLVKEDDRPHRLPRGTPVNTSLHRDSDTQVEFPYVNR